MKYYVLTIPIFAALAIAAYVQPAAAPEIVKAQETEGIHRPRVHATKYIYDRVGPEQEAFRQPGCTMPGRVRWNGGCWLPSRIPSGIPRT